MYGNKSNSNEKKINIDNRFKQRNNKVQCMFHDSDKIKRQG